MSDLKTPHVPISKIDVDSGSNVRTHINEEKLKGLTASIEAVGVVTPLDVRPKENGRFDLISGERRYLAAELAGLKEVPVIFGKGDAHLSKVVENLQREDLDPIDNTFTNYHNASGLGPRIDAGAWIQVSCKVYDPYIQSVNPDGYWYRIASAPWNDGYYSPANTFMNGDPWNGPYTHNTDFNVPNCGSSPPPAPAPLPAPAPAPPPSGKQAPGGSPGTGGSSSDSCLQYHGSRIPDSGSVALSLLGHYFEGLGDEVVIDWSYFSGNSSFVKEAKSLGPGQEVIGWAAPSGTDMYNALGHFTIERDTVDCYLVYDHYDFKWDTAKKYLVFFPLWAIQIFGAREFDEHASGKL